MILGEVKLLDAATRMLIQAIRDAYPRQEIACFPEATGSRSQTSSMVPGDDAEVTDTDLRRRLKKPSSMGASEIKMHGS